MEQNLFQRLSSRPGRWLGAMLLLAAGSVLASCSDDPADGGQNRPFAAGEYPVTLAATVNPATRATSDDMWTGGEQVAVAAFATTGGTTPDWSTAEVRTYTADDDGTLRSDAPHWWTNSAERKTLRAWYCGDGSAAASGTHASAVPTAWSVAADQSGDGTGGTGSDAADGYQQSDLLFAPPTKAAFAGDAAVPLRFYHQTAKVVINIKKTEYVTDAAQILSVKIGDGDLVLTAGFTAPAVGATAGTWDTASAEADGTVIPRVLDAPAKDGCVASYEALVIPQPTAGKRMVAVETDAGVVLYYTASVDAEPLAAGKVRTYTITLEKEAITGIEATGNTWGEGELIGLATDKTAAAYKMSNGRLVPKDARNPLRWDSKNSTIAVVGWYAFGMSPEYAESRPEIFTVQTDQSTEDGVRRSDFLYAAGNITYGGNNSLAFKHCLTKLRVNVTYKGGATGSFDWKYPFLIDGLVGENGSVTADANGSASVVRPMKLATPYGGCDETFEFMLPVQFLKGAAVLATYTPSSGGGPIELKLPTSGIQLKTGVAMAIAVVISPLQITVNGSISWGEGEGGSGSVEI